MPKTTMKHEDIESLTLAINELGIMPSVVEHINDVVIEVDGYRLGIFFDTLNGKTAEEQARMFAVEFGNSPSASH